MKKKIKQWFIGLLLVVHGGTICCLGVGIVFTFINMMNTTGKEFIGNFLFFLFEVFGFLILPYVFFKQVEDGVQNRWK